MRKGVWDDSNTDLSRYRLSDVELLQKHASIVSKNKEAARVEWAQKQALLKQGIVPKEMQEVIKKPKPAPAKKECKSTLKRSGSGRPSSATSVVGMKTQQARFSGLRTTAGVDPQAATLKLEATEGKEEKTMPKNDTFESLKRLDEAMSQLEKAMVSAIQDPVPTKGEHFTGNFSSEIPIKYSPETLTSYHIENSPKNYYQKQISCGSGALHSAYLEQPQASYPEPPQPYSTDVRQPSTFPIPDPHLPSQPYIPPKRQPYSPPHQDEDEVSESSVFSLSPDHSQDTFNPQNYRYDSDEIIVPPTWQEYENVQPGPVSSYAEPKVSNRAEIIPVREELEEPKICSVETADYLAQMLEQTRKDLQQMQIPDQCTQVGEEEEFPQLPPVQSFGRNYEGDLMPRPYILKPVARELYNPIVRSAAQLSNSLSLGSSLGPAPQKYPLKTSPP